MSSPFALTNVAKNYLIDHLWRTAAMPKPLVWWWALFTVAPTEVGGGTEVTTVSTGYGRVELDPSNANYASTQGTTSGASTGSTGLTSNAVAIQYGAPLLNWGSIAAIGAFDANTAGNLWVWAPVSPALQINQGDLAPAIPIGALVFRLP